MRSVLMILMVLMSAKMGLSIWCYDCSSAQNSMCLDLASYDKETVDKYVNLVECERNILDHEERKFFCRKIVQTIFPNKNRDPIVLVNRACGWIPDPRPCYKADSPDHQEIVCQCFTDGCNGASVAQLSALTLLAAVGLKAFL